MDHLCAISYYFSLSFENCHIISSIKILRIGVHDETSCTNLTLLYYFDILVERVSRAGFKENVNNVVTK